MKVHRKNYRLIIRLGIVLYPIFFILDWNLYPGHKWALLGIRGAVVVFLSAVLFLLDRVRDKVAVLMINASFVIAALSITLMCYVSGEGFRSPYYAGLFLIIIAISALINMEPRHYLYVISAILTQHFLLLSFAPSDLRGILVNLFMLGSFCAIGILLHFHNYGILNEIKKLQGFLPICANCKKIRDDKGYWNQIEQYVQERSDAVFSHGLCPECAHEYFEEIEKMEQESHAIKKPRVE